MKAIAINNIPLFDNNKNFYAQLGMEYECVIKGDKVEIRNLYIIKIDLERFNMIFIDKNELLRRKRQSKMERICND